MKARSVVAWSLCALALLALASSIALSVLLGTWQSEDTGVVPPLALGTAAMALIGALIAARAGNPIGWLLLAIPTNLWVAQLAGDIADHGLPRGALYARIAYWLAQWPFFASMLLLVAVFYLFPTGRIPSPRWRWPWRVYVAASAITIVGFAVLPYRQEYDVAPGVTDPEAVVTNPFGLEPLEPVLGPLLAFSGFSLLASGFLAFVSLAFRYRRAGAEERQQLRWLFAVGALALVTLVAWMGVGIAAERGGWALGSFSNVIGPAILSAAIGVGIPVATGIAVFRYHLYDLGLVVRKTVVYAILAGFITIVYIAIVAGLGSTVSDDLVLSIVATAVVAVAFQPVRERSNRFANRLVYGKRATPYEVLARFSERVGGTYAAEDVLPRTARVIAEGTAAEGVQIWLRIGDAWRRSAAWPVEDEEATLPAVGEDLPDFEGVDRAVPVRHHGELLGAVTVRKPPNEPLTPAEAKLLDDLAGQAGLVVSNARLTAELRVRLDQISARAAELRASRQRIVATQDAERRRLERNIHDGAQQHLVALAVKLRLARSMLERDPEKGAAILGEVGEQVGAAAETLGALALGIYPPVLEERGLVAALQAQARFGTLPVRIEDAGVGRLPIEVEAAVYFVCLEALQNAAKYASASEVIVRLSRLEGEVRFEVADDGAGFLPSANGEGTGIAGMRDRLAVLGGAVQVESMPGRGTTVAGIVPLTPAEAST